MSTLKAVIKSIKSVDTLNLVTFDFNGIALTMMSLELASDVLVGKNVLLNIKSSSVALAKDLSGQISYINIIHANIKEVSNGELLSSIKLQANGNTFEALITKEASLDMDLQEGQSILALLKASELSIAEVLD